MTKPAFNKGSEKTSKVITQIPRKMTKFFVSLEGTLIEIESKE